MNVTTAWRNYSEYVWCSRVPDRYNQDDMNDLIRDLNLSEAFAELLASRLMKRNLPRENTKVTFSRNRDLEFLPYFREFEDIVVCNGVESVLFQLGIE